MTEARDTRRSRSRPSFAWPILLIGAGSLFLLNTLGYVDVNFWELWRLWPLLLILGGIDLLFAGRSVLGNLIAAAAGLAVVGLVLYLAVTGTAGLAPDEAGDVSLREPLDGAEQASLQVSMDIGDLWIEALEDSGAVFEGELNVSGDDPAWSVSRAGGRVEMVLDQVDGGAAFATGGGDDWRMELSPQVGYSLAVDLGAGSAEIDLSGLDVRDLDVDTGAGRTVVRFPDQGDFSARVNGDVGELVLEVPASVAVRLTVDRGLTTLDLSPRFEPQAGEGAYLTEGWLGAEHRLELYVEMGVGLLTIRDR